jgi:hypothetical protein
MQRSQHGWHGSPCHETGPVSRFGKRDLNRNGTRYESRGPMSFSIALIGLKLVMDPVTDQDRPPRTQIPQTCFCPTSFILGGNENQRPPGLLRPLGLAQATSIPSAHQLLRKAAINSTILWLSQCCSPLDANLMRAWGWRHSPLSFQAQRPAGELTYLRKRLASWSERVARLGSTKGQLESRRHESSIREN